MAAYSYKEVCHRPEIQKYVDQFEQNYGREFDGDSNYDGDYWLVADDYISDLIKERDELVNALESAEIALTVFCDGEDWIGTVPGDALNEVRKVLDKVKP